MAISWAIIMRISKAAFILMVFLLTVGCGTTTQQSRNLAQELSGNLDSYIKTRREAIESLNQSYRSTYSILLNEQRELSADRLTLQRDEQARAMADAILLNWAKATTYSAISAALKDTREKQLLGIESRAEAIAKAKSQYLESYSALSLDLKKLEKAKKNLADLSEGDAARDSTVRLLIMIGKAYNEAKKETE